MAPGSTPGSSHRNAHAMAFRASADVDMHALFQYLRDAGEMGFMPSWRICGQQGRIEGCYVHVILTTVCAVAREMMNECSGRWHTIQYTFPTCVKRGRSLETKFDVGDKRAG